MLKCRAADLEHACTWVNRDEHIGHGHISCTCISQTIRLPDIGVEKTNGIDQTNPIGHGIGRYLFHDDPLDFDPRDCLFKVQGGRSWPI